MVNLPVAARSAKVRRVFSSPLGAPRPEHGLTLVNVRYRRFERSCGMHKRFFYAIAITSAGLLACWIASMIVAALETVVVLPLSTSIFGNDSDVDTIERLVLRLAAYAGLMVGGYVAAWVASRLESSEVKHSILVGCIYGGLGVLADDRPPIAWVCLVLLMSAAASCLGGLLRAAQVRRNQTTPAVSRFK